MRVEETPFEAEDISSHLTRSARSNCKVELQEATDQNVTAAIAERTIDQDNRGEAQPKPVAPGPSFTKSTRQSFIESLQLDVDYWKAQFRKLKARNAQLEQDKTALTLLIDGFSAAHGALTVQAFLNRQRECERVRDELDVKEELQALRRIEQFGTEDNIGVEITRLMNRTTVGLRSVLKHGTFAAGSAVPTVSDGHPLMPLVRQALGIEWGTEDAMEFLHRCRARPEVQEHSILALCGAALTQWVFEGSQADLMIDRYGNCADRTATDRYRTALALVACEGKFEIGTLGKYYIADIKQIVHWRVQLIERSIPPLFRKKLSRTSVSAKP
jgi:hypothetical protein